MKKLFVTFTSLIITFAMAAQVNAQTPKVSVTPEKASNISEKLNEEINNLKEKIASRVSELNLVEKRGLIGTVSELSGNQVTITDMAGNPRFVDVDEITKFSSPGTKTFGLSDLTKGTRITALGLYNKQSKRLLARFINTSVDPVFVSGTIASVDTKNFQMQVVTKDQKQTKIDNQTTTKIFTYSKEDGFTKLGFSKLPSGGRVLVVGYPDKTDPAMLVADRIITIPALGSAGDVIAPQPSTSVTGAQSTPAAGR